MSVFEIVAVLVLDALELAYAEPDVPTSTLLVGSESNGASALVNF